MSDLTRSSFEFHCGLESPYTFCRREWKALAFFGGGFCLVMVAAVLWLDPAFFYPRLQFDPLLYYLKAKALIETGSTAARVGVNVPPFAYAAMPGVLRAPILLVFSDFDTQWRAIQLLNIPLVAGVALMSAYILSWTQPAKRHWLVIGFAFVFTALSPLWIANVFSVLADAPYAAFSLFALLVSIKVLCDPRPLRQMAGWVALFLIVFAIAFMLRFTAPVILVFAATLARGRWHSRAFSPRARRALIFAPVALIFLLVILNFEAIFVRYLREPIIFGLFGEKLGMFLNLFGMAIPDQIMPDFHLGFSQPPIIDIFYAEFAHTPMDALWTLLGVAISATVVIGLWRSRQRFLPEILYLLTPMLVLGLMMPSTPRYLMSYQPFFWVFFLEGSSYLRHRFIPVISLSKRSRVLVAASAVVVLAAAGGLRLSRMAGTGAARSFAVSAAQTPEYVHEVSRTFRSLRGFLDGLPRDKTLLVGQVGQAGQWTAISRQSYYMPDSALESVAGQKEVYLVVQCGTLEYCQSFPEWKNRLQETLCTYGEFSYDSVFAVQSKWARAEVFRVKPAT